MQAISRLISPVQSSSHQELCFLSFALQFGPLVMVERFGVCLPVTVLSVINSRYVFSFRRLLCPSLQFQSRTSHLLNGQGIALDVALVVVERPHLGHFGSGRVLQRGLNLSLLLVFWVRTLVIRVQSPVYKLLQDFERLTPPVLSTSAHDSM